MTNRHEFKEALGKLDKSTRVCILYLEKLIIDRSNMIIGAQQTSAPKVNLKKFESKMDSLQKQIDGLRPKIEAGYQLSRDHDEQEKYLLELGKKIEIVLNEYQAHFKNLYKSGYYKEGTRRKIREEGLIQINDLPFSKDFKKDEK